MPGDLQIQTVKSCLSHGLSRERHDVKNSSILSLSNIKWIGLVECCPVSILYAPRRGWHVFRILSNLWSSSTEDLLDVRLPYRCQYAPVSSYPEFDSHVCVFAYLQDILDIWSSHKISQIRICSWIFWKIHEQWIFQSQLNVNVYCSNFYIEFTRAVCS